MTRALTKKQEAFVAAVIKSGNATQAYRRCYDAKDMKAETINKRACELLKNGKVAGRIAELRAPALEAVAIDIERWMAETTRYAFGEVSDELQHKDKRGYLDMIGKALGSYEKDNSQRAGESLTLLVQAAQAKKR